MQQGGATKIAWLAWLATTVSVSAALAAAMLVTESATKSPRLAQLRTVFLPGATSSGHHQIEIACETCHTEAFGDRESLQAACVRCHGAELKAADDKHPLAKFTDPRNAELLEGLDATLCVTCHAEHRPEITLAMGVTQPIDYCVHCHRDIGTERPSHADLPFTSCANAGCHNFHDDRALYEDFLLRHADAPAQLPEQRVPRRSFAETAAQLPTYPSDRYPLVALMRDDQDAPLKAARTDLVDEWLASAHARSGVNCSACHVLQGEGDSVWSDRVSEASCAQCHNLESTTFGSGKHGMRPALGLSPMTPAEARLPMRSDAASTALGCTTCHGAHAIDVRRAAVEACLGCHADAHSLAYASSPHAELWRREAVGEAAPGTGVSCATCHMPRAEHRYRDYGFKTLFVQHNQNDTLEPNEKMIRPVCQACHGLSFALDALTDRALIERNFDDAPAVHVPSIDMAVARDDEIARQREIAAAGERSSE